MEICIHDWFRSGYSFERNVELVKDAGFRALTLWWGDEFTKVDGTFKEDRAQLTRKAGLKLENVHLPFDRINFIWEDTQEGQDVLDYYIGLINECKINEIPKAILHPTASGDLQPFGKTGLERFKKLIDAAEKNGVIIALENVVDMEYVDYLFDNINSPCLRFCYDSGHENFFTTGIDMLEKYGDKLSALHLHDNDGTGDQHLLPFEGTINWKRVMAHLKKLDYKGPLALEVDAVNIPVTYTFEQFLQEIYNRAIKLLRMK